MLMFLFFNRDRVPRYIINLDLPPTERWNELVADKKSNVELFYPNGLCY